MKKMLAIKFYPFDCDELLSYTKQDYFWPRSSHLNYFGEPYILPLREELYIEKHIFIEENIEICEKISKDIVIKEEFENKIVEQINEDPIIEKDLEVEKVETIEEEIEDESFKDFNEIKSYDCQSQDLFILVVSNTPKFIDLNEVDRFNSIVSSYLVNIVNRLKIKEQEVQVAQLMTFKFGKKTKKMKYSKCLFS